MKKQGFTLVEMLIVVVLVGVLATALVPRLQSVQERARDTKRKADFSTISQALALYHADNVRYPWSTQSGNTYYVSSYASNINGYVVSSGATRIPGLERYLSLAPRDPINANAVSGSTTSKYYRYFGGSGNADFPYDGTQTFWLGTFLENKQDPAVCQKARYHLAYKYGSNRYTRYPCDTAGLTHMYLIGPKVMAEHPY